ncbi:MAG: hypothetical protein COZ06_33125 [Armatimonadetes bacterium CG_4_10_14_3_um_filter_66_18]|nr:hypothetical protein [Armatimonadota bacterium]OIP12049.1 MAG: hypothetical protein AUJ96_01060 [Armatimonadetes bacterium CG2_30_66_41]PIU95336.1 MAG: hypothetical protein COS65_02970 [Armatimonadetes bacterium CG06_land_8_20_14_3_00_66_21]PIX36726.1 MAG: hypothetical protein COZ57_38005 [Armatimonadetes bacterium CG_4_8_14_3_um_filter_66_20]PIY37345.1 MAG: hypothetical protein COZ06_33125 [Armatimonadetes bacterium CG_4_10_14_3_um_filter_66_18]PIZ33863.1 MAG: hypothetical protein COY42_29
MNDRPKIVGGIVVFLAVVTLPIWFTLAAGNPAHRPQPELPAGGQCVEPSEFMRDRHMELLNQWRDAVMRHNQWRYRAADGKEYAMSLSNTCLSSSCHSSKARFCDRCHSYANVNPNCFDCHVDPTAEKQ